MTTSVQKGLIVGLIHIAIVGSLGAKLLIDRATYPRAWARALPVDPDLPIRGRYVRLRLEATFAPGSTSPDEAGEVSQKAPTETPARVALSAENAELVARMSDRPTDPFGRRRDQREGFTVELMSPVAFFIPEHVPDPSVRPAGEELWVEVTLPRRGAPRPIRLAVKKDGVLTPLPLD
jgi:hypothetical protein